MFDSGSVSNLSRKLVSLRTPSSQTQPHDGRNAIAKMLLAFVFTHNHIPLRATSSRHTVTHLAVAPQTFHFPDGSMYCGGVQDGAQHGKGEWHSAAGDVYIGEFAHGLYEGTGWYKDARGNVYEGGFQRGAFQGSGTYLYADGRADICSYEGGREVGEGVRWSTDRTSAWRLRDGAVVNEISLGDAEHIASTFGLAMPIGVFALSPQAQVTLLQHIQNFANSSSAKTPFAYEGYIQVPAQEALMRAGTLVAHSKQPLVDSSRCDAIVAEVESHARARGGWSTKRHASYPTTDMQVQDLPQTLHWLRETLLPDAVWPFFAHAFDFALNGAGGSGDARAAIRVAEAFVVKYNASSGQRELRPHRDGSFVSFNIALNDIDEYEGGGTYFRKLDEKGGSGVGTVRSPKGHLLAHSSALMHGGHQISSGVRYVLVAFCTIDPAYRDWAAQLYEYVQGVVDPGTEDDEQQA